MKVAGWSIITIRRAIQQDTLDEYAAYAPDESCFFHLRHRHLSRPTRTTHWHTSERAGIRFCSKVWEEITIRLCELPAM